MSDTFETPEDKLAARQANRREAPRTSRPGRAPQDHKQKSTDAHTELEFRGVLYEVNPEALDDWELLEAANEAGDAGNMMLMKAYLGESYDLVKEDLRDEETGRVSKNDMLAFFEVVGEEIKNLG